MPSRKRSAAAAASKNTPPILQFYNKRACKERQDSQDKKFLHENLTSLGLKVKCDVPGDGSCFFHAVLDQCDRVNISTGLPHLYYDTSNPQSRARARAMQLRTAVIDYFKHLVSFIAYLYDKLKNNEQNT